MPNLMRSTADVDPSTPAHKRSHQPVRCQTKTTLIYHNIKTIFNQIKKIKKSNIKFFIIRQELRISTKNIIVQKDTKTKGVP